MCTPVILSNVPNASARVQHGKNGVVASRGDIEEIAHWMNVLATDEVLWQQMAKYARESVQDETWEATVEHFLDVLGQTGT